MSILSVMHEDAADAAQYRGLYMRDVRHPKEWLARSDKAMAEVRLLIERSGKLEEALAGARTLLDLLRTHGELKYLYVSGKAGQKVLVAETIRQIDSLLEKSA